MEETSAQRAHAHAPPEGFLRKYVFSLDHKVIGKQYYALGLLAVCIGMALSWLMRFHLVWPTTRIPGLELFSRAGAPGGIITPEYYLSLLTMHGTLMVFFVLTNAPFAAFGNYFLPIQIGAEDMAFPRFNMMSFWTTLVAFLVLILAFIIPDGPPISGWTSYAPLSAVGKDAGPGMGWGMNLWAISIAIFCIGSLLGALNFIATTLDLRAKGMTLMRKPLLSARVIIYSMMSIGFLSWMVWGHHMFVSGMNPFSSLLFSFPTLTITIPATIMTLIWLGSLYGANIRINAASLFALGFISMFVSGGVSGFFLAQLSIDIVLHATYFVVGHFHMVMGVASLFGVFAGTYFWFGKMTGRMMNQTLGQLHFWLTFIGTYCIFMPFQIGRAHV